MFSYHHASCEVRNDPCSGGLQDGAFARSRRLLTIASRTVVTCARSITRQIITMHARRNIIIQRRLIPNPITTFASRIAQPFQNQNVSRNSGEGGGEYPGKTELFTVNFAVFPLFSAPGSLYLAPFSANPAESPFPNVSAPSPAESAFTKNGGRGGYRSARRGVHRGAPR